MTARKHSSQLIQDILHRTPLATRLQVPAEMVMITLLSDLGFREDKGWTDEDDWMLTVISKAPKELAEYQIEKIKKWEADGKPE